jgi:hypothetical protein
MGYDNFNPTGIETIHQGNNLTGMKNHLIRKSGNATGMKNNSQGWRTIQ